MRKKLSAWKDTVSDHVASLTNRVTNYFDGKTALTAVFAGSVVSANILASKIAAFDIPFYGQAAVPAGFLGLGLAFLCSDILSEVYGPEAAHKAVNGTVAAVLASLGLAYASIAMPSAPFYPLGSEFASVLSSSASISIASVSTILVSQNLDVSLFHRAKEAGLPKWVRNIGSTVTSQAVDTTMFILLGFWALPHLLGSSVTPLVALPSLILSQYLVKVGVAAADTPLFYALTRGSE